MTRNAVIAAARLAAIALPASFAHAQVNQHGYSVPFELANAAAQEALRACTANGYAVTVTVVDVSGVPQVVLRGDHSTIHTRDSSFRKAYTVVTVGPLFKQETSGAFAEVVQKNPAAAQLATLPNMIALPGAVAIVARGEIVGGLGVAGSPGGDKDEACAQAGVAKIKSQLPQ
jgi:uncharacterized protein GlcG (DUF336 family)